MPNQEINTYLRTATSAELNYNNTYFDVDADTADDGLTYETSKTNIGGIKDAWGIAGVDGYVPIYTSSFNGTLTEGLIFQYATNSNIGIGTVTPHASALLELSSTEQGLLPPQMTTAQRTSISTPAAGLVVYDTDLNAVMYYNGSAWAAMGGIYAGNGTTPSTLAIAMTDNLKFGTNLLTMSDSSTQVAFNSGTYAAGYLANFNGSVNLTNGSFWGVDGNRFIHYKSSGGDNVALNNLFVGRSSGQSNTGSSNTGVGSTSMNAVSSGVGNSAFGVASLIAVGTGSNNTAGGLNSLMSITTSSGSTAFGKDAGLNATALEGTYFGLVAGRRVTTGSGTTAVGAYALHDNSTTVTGLQNTVFGYQSGNLVDGAATRNTHLGPQTGFHTASAFSYTVAVGYGATASASNQGVIGTGVDQFMDTLILGNPLIHKSQSGSISAGTFTLRVGNPKNWNGSAVDQTNLDGHNLDIKAGAAHGNGNAGDIVLYSGDTGASGSTERGYTAQIKIEGDTGYVIMANLPTSAPATAGALWNNSNVINIV